MLRKIKSSKILKNLKKKQRNRFKLNLFNKAKKPRLSVFLSGKHIYAQIIDDTKEVTLVSTSTLSKELKLSKTSNADAAKSIGTEIANKALNSKINDVVFDRGSKIYHGKVKALAEAARAAGLKF